ncbi:MAG: hypothetical protein KBT11_11675 [Treponema sp.]|nr:hypothetical protein [Candidatus Treponema equifaecale]
MKSLKVNRNLKRLFLSLLFATGIAFASPLQVDYYGVVSSSADSNMLKMAQDVFYTQLKSIDDISVDDKRPDISKTLVSIPALDAGTQKIAFYAEISEAADGAKNGWNCKFNAVTPADGITHSKNEIFESYYKILVNAKTAIEAVLGDLKAPAPVFEDADKNNIAMDFSTGIDIESLAGTWSGEPNTDKIIILRGGRGFVIFKNGATMNIRISVNKTTVNGKDTNLEIKQVGRANASFFPELSRETALNYASQAQPITWNFAITSPDTLNGIKTTLVATASGAEEGTLDATWTRK